MPTPKKNESKKDFMKRCIPFVIAEKRSPEQSAAICSSIYDKYKK